MEEKRGEYRVLVGKSDGKSSLGKPSRRWEDILICICKKGGWGRTGLIWFRIGTGGGVL
jgi:hypothetical protein